MKLNLKKKGSAQKQSFIDDTISTIIKETDDLKATIEVQKRTIENKFDRTLSATRTLQ